MKKFEYKSLALTMSYEGKWIKTKTFQPAEMISQLNELGQEGWKLVSSIDQNFSGSTIEVLLLLKREVHSV